MTKKDLFRVVIKIFALNFIVQTLFTTLPQSYIYFMGKVDFIGIVLLLVTIAIVLLILYLLVVKTDWVINLLKLDKGYDSDQIAFARISNLTVLKFGIILLAGIFIIRNFVPLLTNLGLLFRSFFTSDNATTHTFLLPEVDYVRLIINALNLLIGYLILTNVQRVSRWLNRYEKNEE